MLRKEKKKRKKAGERERENRPASDYSVPLQRRFTFNHAALVRARGGGRLVSDAAPDHAIAVRHGAAIDTRERARTRAVGYAVERYKMMSGPCCRACFAGAGGRALRHPKRIRRAGLRLFSHSGDTVIYNVLGGIGTLVGPILGAGFFQLARQLLAQFFGDQFPYLIPLGLVFIAMIIFLPQGILGFARRCGLIASQTRIH